MVVNPISGTRSKAGLDEKVRAYLAPYGIEVTTCTTSFAGHATEICRRAVADGVDIVISAGGDGTVNEIASAIAHSPVTMGILPLGSGNGLARSLGIPQDVDEALKIIAGGHFIKCDRGLVNGTPFYCTFGVGFDAAVSEKFASRKRRGRISYIQSVFQEFLKYRSQPYGISVNGSIITDRAFLVAVCNASQYGNNAYIAPKAKVTDGLLDLIVIHDGNPISTVKVGVDLLTGFIDKNTRIETFSIKEAVIERLEDGPVHLDGDPGRMGLRLEVRCDAGALRIFTPEKDDDFVPLVSPLKSMMSDLRYDIKTKLNL